MNEKSVFHRKPRLLQSGTCGGGQVPHHPWKKGSITILGFVHMAIPAIIAVEQVLVFRRLANQANG